MKNLVSVFAATALLASAGVAQAMCGHGQSAQVQQTLASTVPAGEEEAASTFEPETVKKPVEEAGTKPAE